MTFIRPFMTTLVAVMASTIALLMVHGAWHLLPAAAVSVAPPPTIDEPASCEPVAITPRWSQPAPEPAPTAAAKPRPRPACDFGEVLLIAASHDPSYSFAAVRPSGGAALFKRAGEAIGNHTVHAIYWDHIAFDTEQGGCQMHLGAPSGKAPATRREAVRRPPRPAPRGGALPPGLADKIIVLGPGELAVDRSALDDIMESFAQLAHGTQLQRRTTGVRLLRTPRRGLLTHIGLRRGDVLHDINGYDVSNRQALLEAYAKLPGTSHITVNFSRGGKRMALDIAIR